MTISELSGQCLSRKKFYFFFELDLVASGYTLWGLTGSDYDNFGVIGPMSFKIQILFFFRIGPDRVVIYPIGSL